LAYQGVTEMQLNNIGNLLRTAHYFMLHTFVDACSVYAMQNFTQENAVKLFLMAKEFDLKNFKTKSKEFILENFHVTFMIESLINNRCIEDFVEEFIYSDDTDICNEREHYRDSKIWERITTKLAMILKWDSRITQYIREKSLTQHVNWFELYCTIHKTL
jgi:hypothetical protein